jgi:hypothetical protein
VTKATHNRPPKSYSTGDVIGANGCIEEHDISLLRGASTANLYQNC